MSDNSQPNSLSAIVDKHDFIDNPLDVYENYTYNLELFVVDRNADRKFQLMEAHNANQIVTDSWPGPMDNSITIAKTGVTTEFHITDLEVQSNSVGNSTNSKIAGTAISLSFSITQVGNTSLVDNLQNSIALCGYPSIPNAVFYIKINFLGYDDKGNSIKLPYTKVLPFTIKDYADLQTQTDSKGTTTLITGVIITDEAITNVYLSKTENGFTYDVAETLEDTLKNFLEKLNATVRESHPTLAENLQNDYTIKASDQFKEAKYYASSMKGDGTNTTESTTKTTKNRAQQIGTVTPLMSIYNIVEDICLNAIEVKKELLKSTPENTNVLKITPYIVPKANGYNAVKGTNVYEIEYYIDFEKKPVVQNTINQADKAKASKKITEEYFKDNHVNKIYNYLFTGKNDQILDFNISLDRQLAKIYTAPQDSYAYEHFLNPDSTEGKQISVAHQQYIALAEKEVAKLTQIKDDSKIPYESLNKKLDEHKVGIKNKLLADMQKHEGGPPNRVALRHDGQSMEQVSMIAMQAEYGELWTDEHEKNYQKREKAVAKLKKKYLGDEQAQLREQNKVDTYYRDAFATQLSLAMKDRIDTSNKIFNSLDSLKKGKRLNQKNLILTENLNDDILSNLSNEDFEIILKSQTNNPIIFERIINKLSEPGKIYTLKTTDVDGVTQAREKYYESKSNSISMINAQMTIKGDPFWIEGYMSPEIAKSQFGNSGSTTDKGLNVQSTMNGPNGCVVVSGVSNGVDLNDNILTRNLITSLYVVTTIASTFSGGKFQQVLTMRKNTDAEYMVSTPTKIGPEIQELGDLYDAGANNGHPSEGIVYPLTTGKKDLSGTKLENGVWITRDSDGNIATTKMAEIVVTPGIPLGLAPPSQLPSNPNSKGSLKDQHGQGVIVNKKDPLQLYEDSMAKAMSSYQPRNAVSVAPKNTFVEHTAEYVEEFEENTDLAVSLQEAAVDTAVPESAIGPALRQTNAGMYLNDLPSLTRICRAEQKSGQMPFVSCDAIAAHNAKVLEIFETTPGVTPTITEINAYLNNNSVDTHPQDGGPVTTSSSATVDYNVITDIDDGTGTIVRDRGEITTTAVVNTEYSDLEIAQFQIAAGGVLTVDGHDPADIEKIVRKASLAKTPETIILEQASGVSSSAVSSEPLGTVVDNDILDTTIPLVVEATKEVVINTPITPPKTEEEFKSDYATIKADTTCVGQCRTTKLMLLSKEMNDATKEQYYIDSKVETVINEAKVSTVVVHPRKGRHIKIKGFTSNTYTQTEHDDRVVLTNGISTILEKNILTSDEVVAKEALITSAVEILDTDIKDNNLIVSDVDRLATVGAIVEKVSNEAALNSISEDDYSTVKAYENAVNNIVTDANSGHRADLTAALHTGTTQGEIVALGTKHDVVTTKSYYFDPADRLADQKLQAKLEEDLALLVLAQPDETISQVATIKTAGITKYIPIKTPVTLPVALEKQPILVKSVGLPVNTYDIVLPGTSKSDLSYLDLIVTDNKLHQHNEASKIYNILLSDDYGSMTTVTDDAGVDIIVKDYSILPAMTYIDAYGDLIDIPDPSTYFGLRTVTYDDMNPAYAKDYNVLKSKIATLFPNISTIDPNANNNGNEYTADGMLIITISGNRFYIEQ
jgi:uncharacterized protein YeeX (DUF496 family)